MTGKYGCEASLGTKIAERIAGDPSCARLVYDLYAGPSLPPPPSSYVLEQAPSTGVERFLDFDSPVDIARIEAVLSFNTFQPSGLPLLTKKESDHPSALFLLPSLFNHSCDPNAAWVCFGDVMVIRATRDIPKGSEVFISYLSDPSFSKREERLRQYFDKCMCDLCTLDRADGEAACKKRATLEEKRETWNTVNKSRQGLQNLEQTYKKKRKHHDSTMTYAYFHLAEVQQKEGDVIGFFHSAMSALQQAGLAITDKSVKGELRLGPHLVADDLPIQKAVPPMMGVMADVYVQLCISISNAFRDHFGDETRSYRWANAAAWCKSKVRTCQLATDFPSCSVHDIRYGGGYSLFQAHLSDPKLKDTVPLY